MHVNSLGCAYLSLFSLVLFAQSFVTCKNKICCNAVLHFTENVFFYCCAGFWLVLLLDDEKLRDCCLPPRMFCLFPLTNLPFSSICISVYCYVLRKQSFADHHRCAMCASKPIANFAFTPPNNQSNATYVPNRKNATHFMHLNSFYRHENKEENPMTPSELPGT